MLGVDEMLEAEKIGFIGGKLTNSVTVKLNDMMAKSIEQICLAKNITVSDWFRELATSELLHEYRHFKNMSDVWGKSKDTSET